MNKIYKMEVSVPVKLWMAKTAFTEFKVVHRDRCKREVSWVKITIICIRIEALLIMFQLWWKKLVKEIVSTKVRIVNKELCYRTYKVILDHIMKTPTKNFSQFKSYKFNNQISFRLIYKTRLILIKIILQFSGTMMKINFQIKFNYVLSIIVS